MLQICACHFEQLESMGTAVVLLGSIQYLVVYTVCGSGAALLSDCSRLAKLV